MSASSTVALRNSENALAACLPLANNMPREQLAQLLVTQRAGDPLGLGFTAESRPPAPPDPDPYDPERESKEYCRGLLTAKEQGKVAEEVKKQGFMTIAQVREFLDENLSKGYLNARTSLDPEIMIYLDSRINMKLFIAGDNVYTREELYANFAFTELGVQPEAVFAAQEVGVFPARKYALTNELEYVARDADDESVEFVMVEDLVGREARKGYTSQRKAMRVAKTKIYIGKERWDDFELTSKVMRSMIRMTAARGGAAAPLLGLLTGGPPTATPLLIADQAALDAQRAAAAAEAERREADLRRREEEQRRREEEQREIQRKLDADMRRIEAMLEAVSLAKTRAPEPPAAPTTTPQDENDSVAI